jgi:DHA1 family tetracycline resistance protein-like MFS transporter
MTRKPPLLVIFLTVFIDLVGFGIVLPLLPLYSENLGAKTWMIGVIMASYSAMQFFFAPGWGRLSDRIGRRPVMLVSTAGATCAYALFAIASGVQNGVMAIALIIASRVFAGICGANITVAQACIADTTPPEQRSKKMGLIGMAFGLGFIFGPVLGWASMKLFGLTGPGWVAAGLCAANFLLALAILPETRKPDTQSPQRPRLAQWAHTFQNAPLRVLVLVFFLATFCFTCFETTLGLLIVRNFHLADGVNFTQLDLLPKDKFTDAATASAILFAYCGIVGAFVQGGPLGKLVKRFGEPKLIAVSLILVAVSLAPLPFVTGHAKLSWGVLFSGDGGPWWAVLILLGLLSIGSGLTRPPVFGMISNLTPANEQGATIGVAQSAGSLARILGPLFAAALFHISPAIPYVTCAALAFITGLIAWQYLRKVPSPAMKPAP